jgi:hypothetical protein
MHAMRPAATSSAATNTTQIEAIQELERAPGNGREQQPAIRRLRARLGEVELPRLGRLMRV